MIKGVPNILMEFGIKGKVYRSNGSIPCLSVVLHYLLKGLPVKFITQNTLEILELLEHNNDISFDQHLNYRLLGIKLSESQLPVDSAYSVINKVLQVVSKYDGLNEYLMVIDAYLEIILQFGMDNSLFVVLDCILKRAKDGSLTDNEMDNLLSILIKLIHHLRTLEDIFTLDHFLPVLDLLDGYQRNIVNKYILSKVTRDASIRDPRMIQFLFEVSRVLHDSIDISSFKDDHQQTTGLICHFVRMVDFGDEMEHHLEFLIECRAAFRNLDHLKESFIHSSNFMATKAIKGVNKFQGFIKACIAFNEVTIPSISATSSRLNLYLETAEVALSGGLVSHAYGLLDSVITCLGSTDVNIGLPVPLDADWLLSSILKLCGILIVVPCCSSDYGGHIVRKILSIAESQSWVTPVMKVKILCAIVSLSATLLQKELPYQVNARENMGNNLLFFEEKSYYQALESASNIALCNLLDCMEKQLYTAEWGKMALDVCNCLVISLKASPELLSICARMIKIATSCLHPQEKYLQATTNLLKKCMPDSLKEPFTVIACE
uniref:UPF0505 protein n=1 Tax=Anthurium amnicola TaxID=1678845 RepID=A0A1D1YEX0_9ARAE